MSQLYSDSADVQHPVEMEEMAPVSAVPEDTDTLLHKTGKQASTGTRTVAAEAGTLGLSQAQRRGLGVADLAALLICMTVLAVGVAAVASQSFAWMLSRHNGQLIVLGLVLGIMSICLLQVGRTLFPRLAARFSTIRRPLLVALLVVAVVLPLGLGAAYKSFGTHSFSTRIFSEPHAYMGGVGGFVGPSNDNSEDYTAVFGLFAPPGVQQLGQHSGVSIFFNATQRFSEQTAPVHIQTSLAEEPSLPSLATPVAYGYNLLLIDNTTAAAVDMPQPSSMAQAQADLALSEQWTISASVLGTVARINVTQQKADAKGWNATFMEHCAQARGNATSSSSSFSSLSAAGAFAQVPLANNWTLALISNPSPGDQSVQYLALAPEAGSGGRGDKANNIASFEYSSCAELSHYARRLDIVRAQCTATWVLTRNDMGLTNGSCADTPSSAIDQLVLSESLPFLGVWYPAALAEFLGAFSESRSGSAWEDPYLAVGTAAMLWSRITALLSTANSGDIGLDGEWRAANGSSYLYRNTGIMYKDSDDGVLAFRYQRPTLPRSGLLFFVLALQPLLLVLALVLAALLPNMKRLPRG